MPGILLFTYGYTERKGSPVKNRFQRVSGEITWPHFLPPSLSLSLLLAVSASQTFFHSVNWFLLNRKVLLNRGYKKNEA